MTAPTRTVTIRVRRQQAPGSRPHHSDYQVPATPHTTVLDALRWVKEHCDPTLTFRWSCSSGVCGACGVMADGTPVLACQQPLGRAALGSVSIDPLADMPVERDLVVDLDPFHDSILQVTPWLVPSDDAPQGEGRHVQSPAQLAVYEEFASCIDCLLCQAACPQVGEDSDFLGPAAVAAAIRFEADSRDDGSDLRRSVLDSEAGYQSCVFDGSCSAVCPQGVDPAGALQRAALDLRDEL